MRLTLTACGGCMIAFSSSYVGNTWRTASVNIFDVYTSRLVEEGVLSKTYPSSAGDDVQARIMISAAREYIKEYYDFNDLSLKKIPANRTDR